jgi:hypothetical protein
VRSRSPGSPRPGVARRRLRPARWALPACAALGIALAGCGDVSDAKFRSDVDRICRRSSAELAKIPAPAPDDLPANGRFTGQVVTVVRRTHDQLKAVDAPDAKASEYRKWVSQIKRIRDVIAGQSAAAATGDRARFNSLVEQQNTLLQASKAKAALLGLGQCAR